MLLAFYSQFVGVVCLDFVALAGVIAGLLCYVIIWCYCVMFFSSCVLLFSLVGLLLLAVFSESEARDPSSGFKRQTNKSHKHKKRGNVLDMSDV